MRVSIFCEEDLVNPHIVVICGNLLQDLLFERQSHCDGKWSLFLDNLGQISVIVALASTTPLPSPGEGQARYEDQIQAFLAVKSLLPTTQIWETIMSTYRHNCDVSGFSRQSSRRYDLVETMLWQNLVALSGMIPLTPPVFRDNLCTLGCLSNLSCVPVIIIWGLLDAPFCHGELVIILEVMQPHHIHPAAAHKIPEKIWQSFKTCFNKKHFTLECSTSCLMKEHVSKCYQY